MPMPYLLKSNLNLTENSLESFPSVFMKQSLYFDQEIPQELDRSYWALNHERKLFLLTGPWTYSLNLHLEAL